MSSSWPRGEEEFSSRPYVKAQRTSFRIPDAKPTATPASSIRDDLSSSWRKYEGYLEDETSALGSAQQLIDSLLRKYVSVLTAQPFEVAKVLLQVKLGDDPGNLTPTKATTTVPSEAPISPDHDDSDDSDGEPAYFTSNFHSTSPTSRRRNPPRPRPSTPPTPSPPARAPSHQLQLSSAASVLDVIARNWSKEGAWGTWKGTNATFLYTVLHSLMENWSRSALAALLSVPDIGVEEDMLDAFTRSTHPWTTLGVAAAAAVVAGLVLAPLDLVRTRFLVTPSARRSRGIWSALKCFPSYLCPSTLVLPTILHSLVHPILTVSAPIVLQSKFKLNWDLTPVALSITKLCSATAALFVRLPLETVLRRAQVSVLSTRQYVTAFDPKETSLSTVVPTGQYSGVLGTMYRIVAEEGSRPVPTQTTSRRGKTVTETVYLQGQGLGGLTRGWKISFVGLVGLWSAGMLSGNVEDESF